MRNNPLNLIDPSGLQSGFDQMIRDMTLMAPSQVPSTQVEADQIGQNPLSPSQDPARLLLGGASTLGFLALPVPGARVIGGGGRALAALGRSGFCRLPVGAQEGLLRNPGMITDFAEGFFLLGPLLIPTAGGLSGFGGRQAFDAIRQ